MILKELGSVAEGVTTARAAYELGNRLGVRIPITTAVYRVLYEQEPVEEVAARLMSRDAGPEDR